MQVDGPKNLYKVCTGGKQIGLYDQIQLMADHHCLYCGNQDFNLTLDHFLPKSKFWQYSISPCNLIPACYECNSKLKRDTIPKTMTSTIIHAYYDSDCYFKERWLYAELEDAQELSLSFFVQCPQDWTTIAKERIKYHFDFFQLKNRYRKFSAMVLSDVLACLRNRCTEDKFSEYLGVILDSRIDRIKEVNNWKRVAYTNYKRAVDISICRKI